ncbi:MAG: hypothetical protein ACFBSC_13685 [Microcoleaceae cyanobacterium]
MFSVPLAQFIERPQQSLLSYPDPDLSAERILELEALGVTAIYNYGRCQLQGWNYLGLGYCGLVLLVQYQDRPVALKARRVDAPQESLTREAQMLALANRCQVGCQFLASSSNFLLMEFVAGRSLLDWLQTCKKLGISVVKSILTQLLHQAFRLDQLGLDHGNLRCVTEHAIITATQPVLLDFSSASTNRRPANITTLTQGLFWGTVVAKLLEMQGFRPHREQVIEILRCYKQSPVQENFDQLLERIFSD